MTRRCGAPAGAMVVGLMACVLLLAACGSDDSGSSGDDPADAAQGSWTVESGTVDGEELPLVSDSPVTMVIDGDEVSGVSACNNYTTGITIDGETVEFGLVAGTLMACEEPAMASELAFQSALGQVDTIAVDGDQMTLSGGDAEIVLSRDS